MFMRERLLTVIYKSHSKQVLICGVQVLLYIMLPLVCYHLDRLVVDVTEKQCKF